MNKLISRQIKIILLLIFSVSSFITINAQSQIASSCRQAAAVMRDAAAKCPARKACYLANAAYEEVVSKVVEIENR